MDYPKRIPNVGLVGGKFADENATTGQPGSLIPAAWGNAVSDELLNVIKAAGLTPSEDNNAQLLQAIQGIAASDLKPSVRVATTGPIALSGLQAIDGIALPAGGRVLVKDQANAAQNGIYVASANAWVRAQDANENAEFSPGFIVAVQAGNFHGGSLWQFKNQMYPTVGATDLTFGMLYGKTGVAPGEYRKVNVDALGRVTGGSNPTTLAGYGITDALHAGLTDQVPRFYAPSPGTDYTTVPVEIREAQMVGQAQKGFEYAPRLGFHWTKVASGSLAMDASGVLSWNGNRIWDSSSFNPDNKADRENTYTRTQVDSALAKKADNASMLAELGKRLSIDAVSQQRPRLASPSDTGNWDSTALEIREVQQVGEWAPDQTAERWAPGIAFHWAGKYGGKLHMDVTGVLKWQGRPLATLDSPVFTGSPRADTAPGSDESTRLATTAFVHGTVRNTALLTLGMGQSWQDVKAWRALSTTYTNSTGRPIAVTVTGSIASGASLTAVVNGVVAATHYTNAGYATPPFLAFIVPPGHTYSVNGTGGVTISAWSELR
ncbi:hypothetical protein [Pseudomonas sp. RC3H12]|uniref:hypothetical protein n=1 Tax=Pseudomonas sp. RC3H12 TaxID=2834406 RepID=UPI001BDE7109|nr:hypothetical protein [Pseudomonas sp. RC3H12]QWA30505.1 hypothetical protein KHO27_06395 [Pseudomonas sp. RC3H12]